MHSFWTTQYKEGFIFTASYSGGGERIEYKTGAYSQLFLAKSVRAAKLAITKAMKAAS